LDQGELPQGRADEIADWIAGGRIAVCLPFLLEAGYSAPNAIDHAGVLDELRSLPQVAIDSAAEERALLAQRQLARVGHHRLPPVDLLLAAIADVHGLGILHYDNDYEVIRDKTDLTFGSIWLAERGVL